MASTNAAILFTAIFIVDFFVSCILSKVIIPADALWFNPKIPAINIASPVPTAIFITFIRFMFLKYAIALHHLLKYNAVFLTSLYTAGKKYSNFIKNLSLKSSSLYSFLKSFDNIFLKSLILT